MKATPLSIDGAWVFEADVFPDARGRFTAPFQASAFTEATGYAFTLGQVNQSVSRAGVIRGVHWADVPPGQSKFVSCARGRLLDVVVDIRVGSPTFGVHEVVELDASAARSVFLAEGLGHAFVALEDDTTMTYLCSTGYRPGAERGISPLDPELALPWPIDLTATLSDKDRDAPTLAEARDSGLLPDWAVCEAYYAELRAAG